MPMELVEVTEKVICVHWVRPWSKMKTCEYRLPPVGGSTSVTVLISRRSLVLNTETEYLSSVTVVGTKLSDHVTLIAVEFSS